MTTFWVISIKMVKSAQPGEGGGCTSKSVVYAAAERANTLTLHIFPLPLYVLYMVQNIEVKG
jgi:hypothetical protein